MGGAVDCISKCGCIMDCQNVGKKGMNLIVKKNF